MKCFVVVYQSLSEFYSARLFRGGAREETKKISSKRKKRQHKQDERAKKQRRDSRFYERQQNTHTFEARDKFLRENKRNFLLLSRNALTY